MNVLVNLELIQNILPQLPHDSSIIVVYLKRKLEFKSIYMFRFVRLNIVMKAVMDSLVNDDNTLNKKNETTLNEPISFNGFEKVKSIEGTDALI